MKYPFCVSLFFSSLILFLISFVDYSNEIGLLGKKNFILAKPRIIIKPQIYIGTGHSPKHKLLAKKKKLAVKTLAIGSAVGLLKKLKLKSKLPKIELPSIFPKIPISFSFSVEKPKLEVSKANSWDDNLEPETIAEPEEHLHHHHLPTIGEGPWLGESFDSFPSFPEEYHFVGESKRHKDKVKSSKSSKSKSRNKSIKGSSSNRKAVTAKSSTTTTPPNDDDEEDVDEES